MAGAGGAEEPLTTEWTRSAGPRARAWVGALCAVLALGVAAAPGRSQGSAMGKVVVFSEVRGRVLQDGKPVPGATVEREFDWVAKDERGRDSTTTGAGGEFMLPAIERRSLLASLFPHETLIGQTLTVRHGGRSYLAWRFTKRDGQDRGELGGRPLRLVCRLEAAPSLREGGHYGICDVE